MSAGEERLQRRLSVSLIISSGLGGMGLWSAKQRGDNST